jgi:hypothetical protein
MWRHSGENEAQKKRGSRSPPLPHTTASPQGRWHQLTLDFPHPNRSQQTTKFSIQRFMKIKNFGVVCYDAGFLISLATEVGFTKKSAA